MTQLDTTLPPRFSIKDGASRQLTHKSNDTFGVGFLTKFGVSVDFNSHLPREFAAVYVLRGKGHYIDAKGNSSPLKAGSLFLRVPGHKHSNTIDSNSEWTECFIRLSTMHFNNLQELGILQISSHVLYPGLDLSIADKCLLLLDKLRYSPDNLLPTIWSEVTLLLTNMIVSPTEPTPKPTHQNKIETACKILSSNLTARISIERVAKDVHLSYTYFRRIFKEQMGVSPGEYRIHRRLDRAKALLLSGNSAIKDISYELGYPDPFTFSEQFKKYEGCPPKAFRK